MGAFSHYPGLESTAAFPRESCWSLKGKYSKIVITPICEGVWEIPGRCYQDVNTDADSPVEEKEALPLTPVQEGWS